MIGIFLQDTDEIVEVTFNAIAAGTFIYISASEVIVEEFSAQGRLKWCQYFTFLLGATLITCLWLLEG